MIKFDELKQRFPIENVPPYGECIIIPGAEFDPDWEGLLDEQGYGCVFTDFGEKRVTLVLTKKRQAEPPTPQPPRKPLSAMKGPLWTKESEDRLVKRVTELNGSLERKCRILTKEFQGRSANALLQKFRKLAKARRALPGKRGRPKKVLGAKGLEKALENVCPDCGLPKDLCCCDEEKKESLRIGAPRGKEVRIKFAPPLQEKVAASHLMVFETYCRICKDRRHVEENDVWSLCPVCGGPLIIWDVEEVS